MGFATIEEIKTAFEDQNMGNELELQQSSYLQKRLRFHADYISERQQKENIKYTPPKTINEAYNDFLKFARYVLGAKENESAGRYQMFFTMFANPNSKLIKEIKDEFKHVFTSKDGYENIELSKQNKQAKEEIYSKISDYRDKYLKDNEWFRQKGIDSLLLCPNSIMVSDVGQDNYDGLTRSFFYRVDIENVVKIDTTKKGLGNDLHESINWVMFVRDFYSEQDNQEVSALHVYDDEYYRVFKINNDAGLVNTSGIDANNVFTESNLIAFKQHGLTDNLKRPLCPAKFFGNQDLYDGLSFRKDSPLVNVLEDMDWLLFHETSRRFYEMYGKYPVIVYASSAQDYKDETDTPDEFGNEEYVNEHGEKFFNRRAYEQQFQTKKNPFTGKFIGAGTSIEVPILQDEEGNMKMLDLNKAVAFVSPPDSLIRYNNEESQRLKKEIKSTLIGVSDFNANSQAVNPEQIDLWLEGKRIKLRNIAYNLELTHQFVLYTCLKLRRQEQITDVKISYGTDYYLSSYNSLLTKYTELLNSGLTQNQLHDYLQEAIHTRYKTQPKEIFRQERILKLEPFAHTNFTNLISLYQAGFIKTEEFYLKQNFNQILSLYESENGQIENIENFDQQTIYNELLILTSNYFNLQNNNPNEQTDIG